MLRLYHAPLACSLGSRFALAESGLTHEVKIVRTSRGEQNTEAYLRINPRGQVPALETDEGVLTESSAILPYIADLVPQKALFPAPGTLARAKAQAWLAYLSCSVHAALGGVLRPREGCDNELAQRAALERIATLFKSLDTHLNGRDYVLDAFSVCDLYLAVYALWRGAPEFGGKLPAFPHVDRLQRKVLGRPALEGILGEELRLRMEG